VSIIHISSFRFLQSGNLHSTSHKHLFLLHFSLSLRGSPFSFLWAIWRLGSVSLWLHFWQWRINSRKWGKFLIYPLFCLLLNSTISWNTLPVFAWRTYTPNVSYMNAIDIYMMTCMTIVFLTLFQFTFLYWIRMGRSEYAESRVSLKKKMPAKGRVIMTPQNMFHAFLFLFSNNVI